MSGGNGRKNGKSKKDAAKAYYFDDHAAELAVRFFERLLEHVKGEWAGEPFVLEEWQKDEIVRPLFGWKRADGQGLGDTGAV